MGTNRRILWVSGAAVAVVGALIALSQLGPRAVQTTPVIPSAGRKAIGPVGAPVTLIEYEDFL